MDQWDLTYECNHLLLEPRIVAPVEFATGYTPKHKGSFSWEAMLSVDGLGLTTSMLGLGVVYPWSRVSLWQVWQCFKAQGGLNGR